MYAKIFQSMYDGTLATVGPWESLVTFQQMLVLADRYGVVDMTAEAISRRTTIPLSIIEKGIACLEAADDKSRRDEHEGRRIVRLAEHRDWGWQIVNHAHYRQIRSNEERRSYQREYMREKRDKMRAAEKSLAGFDEFYSAYPRKQKRVSAAKAWASIMPDEPLRATIMKAVALHKQTAQWKEAGGKFIPLPSSWLNGRRWEDEVAPVAAPYTGP